MRLAQPLAVTEFGMTTSLGRGRHACAAFRAGVSRARASSELSVVDPETLQASPLIAHAAGAHEGFFRFGRWIRLACDALEDLQSDGADRLERGHAWRSTDVTLVVRTIDADLAEVDDEDSTASSPEGLRRLMLERFVAPLLSEARLALSPDAVRVIANGPAGLAQAILQASSSLARPSCSRVLVLAVDSWIDPQLAARAAEAHRLKSLENATGFVPGEAAAALVLGRPGEAGASRRPLGLITGASIGRESRSPISEAGGPALAECIGGILRGSSVPFRGDLFLDLTGEEWRAQQWGNAQVRLGPLIESARLRLPATSLGDVGAASGAVASCVAIEAHRRGWAKAPSSLIVSASDSGETGCLAIGSPTA